MTALNLLNRVGAQSEGRMDFFAAIAEFVSWFWPTGNERADRWQKLGCIFAAIVFIGAVALVALFSFGSN